MAKGRRRSGIFDQLQGARLRRVVFGGSPIGPSEMTKKSGPTEAEQAPANAELPAPDLLEAARARRRFCCLLARPLSGEPDRAGAAASVTARSRRTSHPTPARCTGAASAAGHEGAGVARDEAPASTTECVEKTSVGSKTSRDGLTARASSVACEGLLRHGGADSAGDRPGS